MKIVESTGNLIASGLESASQFRLGQFFIRMLDRGLAIVEKTAEWSLPQHEFIAEENGRSFQKLELVRPLPWVIFLPSLIVLRGFRFFWNVGAFIIRSPRIQPIDIVRTLRQIRRRLRVIRVNGGKRLRGTRSAARDKNRIDEAKRSLLESIQKTLSSLSCLDASKMNYSTPVTRISLQENHGTEITAAEVPVVTDFKRKHADIESDDSSEGSENENLIERIDRLAELNSSEDPSFNPLQESSETTSTSEEEENEVEDEELCSIMMEREQMMETYKKQNPQLTKEEVSKSFEAWASGKRETHVEGGDNCTKQSEERQDFYSPCKSIEEVDPTFYSPMSSKSSSPERDQVKAAIEEIEENHVEKVAKNNLEVEVNDEVETLVDDEVDILPAVENKPQPRQSHKGKRRVNHATRRKN